VLQCREFGLLFFQLHKFQSSLIFLLLVKPWLCLGMQQLLLLCLGMQQLLLLLLLHR
jgi:hypothetical protein